MPAKTILADVCEHKKGGEFYLVDPDVIKIDPGWNARKDFSGEDELVELIKTSGVPGILTVKKTEDKRLVLVSGERRLRAARRAREEGADIQTVPVLVAKRGTNDAELFFNDICSNSGKPLTATEEANAFKRLKAWGFEVADIAKKTGRSISHVRNRLELANASPAVQKAVEAGNITISQGQNLAKNESVDEQNTNLEKTKAKPKTKRQVFSFKKGSLKQSGFRASSCEPIRKVLEDQDFFNALRDYGFDPESIRITINPFPASKQKQEQLEMDKFESSGTCIDCGNPIDSKDLYLCQECLAKAEAEHNNNHIKDRAAISE